MDGLTYLQTTKDGSAKLLGEYQEPIKRMIEMYYGVNYDQIKSKSRKAEIALCRKVIANIFLQKYSLHPKIVASWLGRDRTTILFYERTHKDWMVYDNRYKIAYNEMIKFIDAILDNANLHKIYSKEVSLLNELDDSKRLRKENLSLRMEVHNLTKKIKELNKNGKY